MIFGLQIQVQHVIFHHIYGAQNIQKDSNNIVLGDANQHITSLEFDVCGLISDDQTRAVKMSDVPADPDH
jgi:hypothetical protein